MIVFAKENLTSTRIHLGFDETYGLESHEYRISGQIERIRMGDPIVELDEIPVKAQELSNRFIDLY